MKNMHAYIITGSRVKEEAATEAIFTFISAFLSSPASQPEIVSSPSICAERTTFTRSFFTFFFFTSLGKLRQTKSMGLKFRWKLAVVTAIVSVGDALVRPHARAHMGKVCN